MIALGVGGVGEAEAKKKRKKGKKAKVSAKDQRKAAKLNEAGKQAFANDKISDALAAFEAAYDLDPQPRYAFNSAKVREFTGDFGGAIEGYERYLKMAPPDATDRESIEALVALLGKRHEKVQKALAEQEKVAADRRRREEEQQALKKEELATQRLAAEEQRRAEEEKRKAEEVKAAREREAARSWLDWAPWAAMGVGVTALATGVVLALSADNAADDYNSALSEPRASGKSTAETDDLKNTASTLAAAANASFVLGALAAAGGGTLLWVASGDDTGAAVGVVIPW